MRQKLATAVAFSVDIRKYAVEKLKLGMYVENHIHADLHDLNVSGFPVTRVAKCQVRSAKPKLFSRSNFKGHPKTGERDGNQRAQ